MPEAGTAASFCHCWAIHFAVLVGVLAFRGTNRRVHGGSQRADRGIDLAALSQQCPLAVGTGLDQVFDRARVVAKKKALLCDTIEGCVFSVNAVVDTKK